MLIAGIQAIFSFGTGFDGLPVYRRYSVLGQGLMDCRYTRNVQMKGLKKFIQ